MYIKIKELNGFVIAFICSVVLSIWAGLRDHNFGDTEVYLLFYEDLINFDFTGLESCQSFEPLFCTVSYLLGQVFQYNLAVHYIWVFLFFLITYYSLTILVKDTIKYIWTRSIFFIFISINFVDPQIVFYLTRQYVASSLLILGVAFFISNRSAVMPLLSAVLIHFGAVPIAIILFFFIQSKKTKSSYLAFIILLFFIFLYIIFVESYFLEIYYESIKLKLDDYSGRNDGDLTLAQEIKLIFYWGLAYFYLKRVKYSIHNAFLVIYGFYVLTFVSDLIHLRYFKYLESMSWISTLVIISALKRKAPYAMTSLLSFRIYKYITLISPESSIMYMFIFLIMNVYSRFYSILNQW